MKPTITWCARKLKRLDEMSTNQIRLRLTPEELQKEFSCWWKKTIPTLDIRLSQTPEEDWKKTQLITVDAPSPWWQMVVVASWLWVIRDGVRADGMMERTKHKAKLEKKKPVTSCNTGEMDRFRAKHSQWVEWPSQSIELKLFENTWQDLKMCDLKLQSW